MWDELRNPIFLFSETFATSMQTEFPGHSLDEIPRTTPRAKPLTDYRIEHADNRASEWFWLL